MNKTKSLSSIKTWMRKHSMQMALVTSLAGVIISVMPYFEAYLPQWVAGTVMTLCGVATALARVWPQEEM